MTTTHPTAITAAERAKRQEIADESRHNAELEGLVAEAAYEADSADWVEGRITMDELIQRGRERYIVA